jgi:predicted DsbA family dithiol-disulfide isomerase
MDIAPRIDIVSDAICPWCYIGKRQLERALPVLAEQGLVFDVAWHPFQLNPEMPAEGDRSAEYRRQKFGNDPERIRQIDARVREAGAAVGLDIRHDLMRRTPNTVAARSGDPHGRDRGRAGRGGGGAVRGFFTEGEDIGDAAALDRIAAAAGLPGVADMLAGDAHHDAVLAEDMAARQGGIQGVPSFVMAGHVLFRRLSGRDDGAGLHPCLEGAQPTGRMTNPHAPSNGPRARER